MTILKRFAYRHEVRRLIRDIRSRLDTGDLYDLDVVLNTTMRQYETDFDNTLRFMALKELISDTTALNLIHLLEVQSLVIF